MKKTATYNILSWEESLGILSRLQLRLYKCVFTHNLDRALSFQKLIIISKSCRLLAIREMTQKDINKNIAGIDGKTCLSFTERFQLNEFIKLNVCKWLPSPIKHTTIIKKDGSKDNISIPTISDRCWQCIVKYSLEPAHEACFNIRNLGYRQQINIHQSQKLFIYNLCQASYGKQKRIFIINLEKFFNRLNLNYLLKKLILPRSLKLGIFRSLNLGLKPIYKETANNNTYNDLNSLLCNIILEGIENIHASIHFGYEIAFFLKPKENEVILCNNINKFLLSIGSRPDLINSQIYSSLNGFDFLGWNFKVSKLGEIVCIPNFKNHQNFLLRVKRIINNSNYGAVRVKLYN